MSSEATVVQFDHVQIKAVHLFTFASETSTESSRNRQFMTNELFQSFKVLRVKLNVIVAGSLDPEGFHCSWALLVHCKTMGKINHFILSTMNYQHGRSYLGYLVNAWKCIKTECFPGIREGHTQARHKRRMEDNSCTFITGCKINCWNRANTLTIQNNVLRTNTIPCPQRRPRCVNVSVKVLLGRFPVAGSVTRVIVGEDVAVDAGAQADVEAAHLAQVHGVAVREEQRVAGVRGAADEHAADAGAAAGASEEHLQRVELPLRVLPVGPIRQVQSVARLLRQHRVGGLGREESELGCDAARARRAAEEPAQLAEGEAIHPEGCRRSPARPLSPAPLPGSGHARRRRQITVTAASAR